jgi:hypothetical protein
LVRPKDGLAGLARTPDELATTSPRGLRAAFLSGLRITSMDGKEVAVRSAQKLRTKKYWWQPPVMFQTLIVVSHELEEVGRISFGRLMGILLASFKSGYPILPGSSAKYRDIAAGIEKCQSYGELADWLRRF